MIRTFKQTKKNEKKKLQGSQERKKHRQVPRVIRLTDCPEGQSSKGQSDYQRDLM